MWGLLGMKEQDMEGENSSPPQLFFCSFLLLSFSFPPQYSACSSKCMNAWMAWQNTLQDLFLLDNLAFFFFPLLTTLSTAGSSARLWIWKSHTWFRHCCLKIRPRKQTSEIRVTCRTTWFITWESVRPWSLVKILSRVGYGAAVLDKWSVQGKEVVPVVQKLDLFGWDLVVVLN